MEYSCCSWVQDRLDPRLGQRISSTIYYDLSQSFIYSYFKIIDVINLHICNVCNIITQTDEKFMGFG